MHIRRVQPLSTPQIGAVFGVVTCKFFKEMVLRRKMGGAFIGALGVVSFAGTGTARAVGEPPQVKFTLPANASTADLQRARLFPEPLVPIGGVPTAAENAAVAAALTGYASARDLGVLELFASANPNSPWLVSVLTNLGLLEFQQGYFSKALSAWKQAWTLGKTADAPAAQAVVNRAVAELIKLYDRVGRMAETKALLAEVKERNFRGLTANMIANARQAVGTMELHPAEAFKCGPFAVSNVLESLHQETPEAALKIKRYGTTAQGTSLAQVLDLATQVGLKMQAAKRTSGTALPLPAIVNWKLDHYGALLKQDGDRYLLVDPTFGTSAWVSTDAISQEASGYFLIPAGPLPEGWTAVDAKEAGTVWGRGLTGRGDPGGTKGGGDGAGGGGGCGGSGGNGGRGDVKCPTGNCDKPPPGTPDPCGNGGGGMAQWSFFEMLASLSISDTPLYYQPPVGPMIAFRVSYAAMEQNQPSTINYSNLGPLWNFSWLSSITFDSANAFVNLGGGGYEDYVNFNSTTQSYDPQPLSECVLVKVSATDYERRAPDSSKMVFSLADSSGRIYLTQIVDRQGNAIKMAYDANFRLTTLTDAIGQVTTLSYGSDNVGDALFYNITKVTDPFGRFATFSYNGAGQLATITDVLGIQSQFTYGANDFIQTLTTPYGATNFTVTQTNTPANGNITSLVATEPGGAQQRVDAVQISTTTPDSEPAVPTGMPVTNQYLIYRNSYFWGRKAMHDAPGDYSKASVAHFLHILNGATESGIVESTKEPLESRIWYFYQNGNPNLSISTTPGMLANPIYTGRVLDDGSTQLVQNTYNSLGFLTQNIDPVGRTTNYTYATNGIDLLNARRVNGSGFDQLASVTWNGQHSPLSFTGADGETYTYTYNAQGERLSSTDPKGETTALTYDAHGYLTSAQGPMAGPLDASTFTYDAFGRIQTATDGEGYTLTYSYDALNRLTSTTYPDGTSDQTVYTNLLPTQTIDRLGRTTTFAYNGLLQLISVTDPLNRVVQFARCSCGEVQRLIDPLGQTTSWTYDIESRPTSKIYADGSADTYTYTNTNNLLASVTDAKGQTRTRAYNPDDSLASITYSSFQNPTPDVVFVYDPFYPRLVSMTDGIGTTTWTYQPVTGGVSPGANQLATVDGPWGNSHVAYSYDALGRVLSRSINGVAQTISYDVLGRVPSVTNALGTFHYTYENDSSRVTKVTKPNGTSTTASYFGNPGDRRLQQIKNLNGDGSNLSEFDYTYDALGNILTWNQVTDANPGINFTMGYDAADQITAATASGPNYGYTYDVAGNRLTQSLNGATTTASYNALNELQQVSPSLGNDKTYQWDAENRLVGINYTGTNQSTQLSYDGAGRCAQIVEYAGSSITSTKRFLWCGTERCEEHDALDNVTRRFFNQGEQIGGTPFFYTVDHLGSTREMTDSAGTLRARYGYDPYGTRTKLSGDLDASLGFTGHYYHAPSGLHLAPFRAYDAPTGRWISRDPVQEAGGINLFAYVGNRVVNSFDPLGFAGGPVNPLGPTIPVGPGGSSGPLQPNQTVTLTDIDGPGKSEVWQYISPGVFHVYKRIDTGKFWTTWDCHGRVTSKTPIYSWTDLGKVYQKNPDGSPTVQVYWPLNYGGYNTGTGTSTSGTGLSGSGANLNTTLQYSTGSSGIHF